MTEQEMATENMLVLLQHVERHLRICSRHLDTLPRLQEINDYILVDVARVIAQAQAAGITLHDH
jgi:hypothetical protein